MASDNQNEMNGAVDNNRPFLLSRSHFPGPQVTKFRSVVP
ncbi:hypothetical protein RISK_003060 [Rhodopirellula islandica]|uniref:Uncharacterized protein n=1 Tax=Rhodopirellula islandica TaxID=595434 RepID=A0A0J1BDX6_RHOIS|nr:hypothetical protein RISK_003060 [Rhodopirellula islandica]